MLGETTSRPSYQRRRSGKQRGGRKKPYIEPRMSTGKLRGGFCPERSIFGATGGHRRGETVLKKRVLRTTELLREKKKARIEGKRGGKVVFILWVLNAGFGSEVRRQT